MTFTALPVGHLSALLLLLVPVQGFLTLGLSFKRKIPVMRTLSPYMGPASNVLATFDYNTQDKLPWLENGYQTWKWNNYSINYVALGNENADGDSKEPLLLIHGFGASAYHWRYNIPYLARKYRVYAIDLLGFGLSDKPIIEYNADIWRDQVLSFIEEVVKTGGRKDGPGSGPCVVAGNSLGGYAALSAAAAPGAREKDLISGCILLNAAGRFKSPDQPSAEKKINPFLDTVTAAVQRFVISMSFLYTKQPARIKQVLQQVYPVDPSNVDAELVESIRLPAEHPNAAEVFYRVVSRNGRGPPTFVDDLLDQLQVPLLLLWGLKVGVLSTL